MSRAHESAETDSSDLTSPPSAPEQRSRTSLKNERVNNEKALSKLGEDLANLSPEQLEKLGASEDLIESLVAAKGIRSFGAKKRHMRLIRAQLREEDWTRLRKGMDHFRAGFELPSTPPKTSGLADRWCEQLLIQGDPGLARFCEEFEQADRKRLRQLIRNVRSAPSAKRGKARLQLERALLDLLGDQP